MIYGPIAAWFVAAAASIAGGADLAVQTEIYKTADGRPLELRIAKPADAKPGDHRPCLVFFHGGGWVAGSDRQFDEQAKYLITRGIVVIQPAYRLLDRSDARQPPDICIQDAKSAMRWVRSHANTLNIDPDRIAAGGGSAGGHLAAFVGLASGIDDPHDDLAVSAKANALVLFNPVLDNGANGGWGNARVGDRVKAVSPAHNVTAAAPPTAIFIGRDDHLVPTTTIQRFADTMKQAGVRCDLHLYDDQGHGFFNKEPYRTITLIEADRFLASIGYLDGEPTTTPPAVPAADGSTERPAKKRKRSSTTQAE